MGKLALELRNKVKVGSLAFGKKAWSDSNFVWRKLTREALLLMHFQLGTEGKLRDNRRSYFMISREM